MSNIDDPIPEDNNADSIRNRQQDADDLAARRDESIRTLRERRDWLRARIIAKKSVGWETQYDEREERALTWALAELNMATEPRPNPRARVLMLCPMPWDKQYHIRIHIPGIDNGYAFACDHGFECGTLEEAKAFGALVARNLGIRFEE